MLGIEARLLTAFHLQTDGQTEQMNQELKQYLKFFTEYKQRDWPQWLATAEFAVNNKVHIATKVSPFMSNYGRELRMEANIRRKSRESDRICRKNEESTRESRSSIEEGTEGYEKTNRQRTKRSREVKEE